MKHPKTNLILSALALIAVIYAFTRDDTVKLGPGVLAPNEPEQQPLDSPKGFVFKHYQITPLAEFHIVGKVLGRKTYDSGRETELSPVDLALGWGRMSDESVLQSISITQSNRWYRWRVEKFPIPRREIETHSANMHLVPADEDVAARIKKVRKGEIIELWGNLIRVRSTSDGWHWASSLTRKDTGSGACELIWVEDFEIKTSPSSTL